MAERLNNNQVYMITVITSAHFDCEILEGETTS